MPAVLQVKQHVRFQYACRKCYGSIKRRRMRHRTYGGVRGRGCEAPPTRFEKGSIDRLENLPRQRALLTVNLRFLSILPLQGFNKKPFTEFDSW